MKFEVYSNKKRIFVPISRNTGLSCSFESWKKSNIISIITKNTFSCLFQSKRVLPPTWATQSEFLHEFKRIQWIYEPIVLIYWRKRLPCLWKLKTNVRILPKTKKKFPTSKNEKKLFSAHFTDKKWTLVPLQTANAKFCANFRTKLFFLIFSHRH